VPNVQCFVRAADDVDEVHEPLDAARGTIRLKVAVMSPSILLGTGERVAKWPAMSEQDDARLSVDPASRMVEGTGVEPRSLAGSALKLASPALTKRASPLVRSP
jgi:hypothetical protein